MLCGSLLSMLPCWRCPPCLLHPFHIIFTWFLSPFSIISLSAQNHLIKIQCMRLGLVGKSRLFTSRIASCLTLNACLQLALPNWNSVQFPRLSCTMDPSISWRQPLTLLDALLWQQVLRDDRSACYLQGEGNSSRAFSYILQLLFQAAYWFNKKRLQYGIRQHLAK